jgi:hypothetical protein
LLDLQNHKGQVAQAIAYQEACHIIEGEMKPAAEKLVATHKKFKGEIIYSFDNDRAFTKAVPLLKERGIITDTNRAPLPPKSPDMHKVVEHCHAIIVAHFQKFLLRQKDLNKPMAFYIKALEDIFFTHITAKSVMADVKSLKATYRAIIAAKGAYPNKKYR